MDFECKKECFDELRARGFIHRRSVGSKFETTCLFRFLLNNISKFSTKTLFWVSISLSDSNFVKICQGCFPLPDDASLGPLLSDIYIFVKTLKQKNVKMYSRRLIFLLLFFCFCKFENLVQGSPARMHPIHTNHYSLVVQNQQSIIKFLNLKLVHL